MVTLTRYAYTPLATFGKLAFQDFTCYTIERQWNNNIANTSCIPEFSNYILSRYTSPKFGNVMSVSGGTVAVFPTPNYARSSILIHPANYAAQLEGCIALGDSLGVVNEQWSVLNSRATLNKFLELIGTANNTPFSVVYDPLYRYIHQ